VFVDGQLYEPSEDERPQGGPGRQAPGMEGQEVIR
jgi:hypothetical protein